MKYANTIKLVLGGILTLFVFCAPVSAAPLIANYYLGVLPSDAESLKKFSKTDLLIVSPDQFITKAAQIAELKKDNPKIILLAYVPSQSYNKIYWPNDLVYSKMIVRNEWLLKDKSGNEVSNWPGLQNINLEYSWSEYLVGFINNNIGNLPNVDGIFLDMVNEGISSVNHGDVELTNADWIDRMKYLLSYARQNINTKYLVINGSSYSGFQSYVNGRMYETFPTPWEANGSWSGLMTRLEANRALNQKPQLYIFNSNSNNSGKQNDYKKVRFGLASSLMVDNVYFGYDFGDQNHGQVWWYDEYDAKLGNPSGSATALHGSTPFALDVWRRDYANGLALVNPTNENQKIDLGGEYEKLIGTQDNRVNNGGIVDTVTLPAKDGLLLYKTFQNLQKITYPNGAFLRFFKSDGSRARNGFFSFENTLPGGANIYVGDLDNDGKVEKIVANGSKIEIFNSEGARWLSDFPFGGNFKGELKVTVGKFLGGKESKIIVTGSVGGKVVVYNYHGEILKTAFSPLGKNFTGGLSASLTKYGGKTAIVFGTGGSTASEVVIFDENFKKVLKRFYPWGKTYKSGVEIAAGDLNGDGLYEIAATKNAKSPGVGIFSDGGKLLKSVVIKGLFGKQKIGVGVADFKGEAKKELVVISKN